MEFGPAIPHNPHGYTAPDGTHYPAVFPYGGHGRIEVTYCDGMIGLLDEYSADDWPHFEENPSIDITSYRLPADHHAYGPKVSRMGREPDLYVNAVEDGKPHQGVWSYRAYADFSSKSEGRLGIWRIYLKDKAA
jgi:hypothetical protein